MSVFDFNETRVVDLGNGCYAYILSNETWNSSNTGLVVDEGESLLIDTLVDEALTKDMLEAYRAVTPAADKINTIVNTHENGDHWRGNNVADADEIITTKLSAEGMAGMAPTDAAEVASPTRIFEGCLDLMVGNKKVELYEVGPAHTTGDLIVNVPHARVVYAADIIFAKQHQVGWVGPASNFIKACDLIVSLEPEYVVSGHGPVVDIAWVKEVKGYWEWYLHGARILFNIGMDAMTASKELYKKGPYSHWRQAETSFINVAMMYKEFSGDNTPLSQVSILSEMHAKWDGEETLNIIEREDGSRFY